MPADWTIKQGDTKPVLTDALAYSTGDPVDLTGATLKFVLRSLTAQAPVSLTGVASIVAPLTGAVQFTPSAADTANAGQYAASWVVTFPDSSIMSFPTVGYLWVTVEEAVGAASAPQLVSLPDVKEYLNISTVDRARDAKLVRFIHALRPIIENITGPILPTVYEEWHDGGQYWIQLRRRPSSAYGTSPLLTLVGVDEYRGPMRYPLSIVADPAQASIYSCMLNPQTGQVVRRTTGGGVVAFPAMPQSVHVVYQAGQQTVPANVMEGTLELLRVNYATTQMTGRGSKSVADNNDVGPPLGFFVPRRVRELLAPNRRAPSIA